MKYLFVILLWGSIGFVKGQIDAAHRNNNLTEITKTTSKNGWIDFKDDNNLNPLTIFEKYKNAFGLQENNEMRLLVIKTDNYGYTHYRFQQYYNGMKVIGAEYIIHTNSESVCKSANGKIAIGLSLPSTKTISENIALKNALNEVNAKKYEWELNDSLQYLYPQGEKVITRLDNSKPYSKTNYCLAYKFKILGVEPEKKYDVFVDAISGKFVKKYPLVNQCLTATGFTSSNGTVDMCVKKRGFPFLDCILKDDSRGDGIETKKQIGRFFGVTVFGNITGPNCSFSSSGVNDPDEQGQSAHWAAMATYDYFLNKHSLNSVDGFGQKIKIRVYADKSNAVNAFWERDENRATFGRGNGTDANAFVSIDIVAHEISHGVAHHSAGLIGSGEPGALGESFSDIFGTMVEQYAETVIGYTPDIGQFFNLFDDHMGEDMWLDGPALRSLSNPKTIFANSSQPSPNTFNGDFWINPNSIFDDGGIHFNNGVQNSWFMLLSKGGSGNIDDDPNNPTYSVAGISRTKAAQIAFLNLTEYLSSESDFNDAREGAIKAAEELFGVCSFEAIQTANAWSAVGVGSPASLIYNKVFGGPHINDQLNTFTPVWADIDNDGDEDLFVTVGIPSTNNLTEKNVLYKNLCNGNFAQVIALPEGIVSEATPRSQNASFVDIDNDGDVDAFITNEGDNDNLFYSNNGDGTFLKSSAGDLGIDAGFSRAHCWADFNNDGFVDVYVGNNGGNSQNNVLYLNNGNGTFTKTPTILDVANTSAVATGDFNNDGNMDLALANRNTANKIFMGDGAGGFTNVGGIVETDNPTAGSRGVSWVDFDNDLDLDLFITNSDGEERNALYRNDWNTNTEFIKITSGNLVTDFEASEGGAKWGDIDNDGDMDCFVMNLKQNSLYINNGFGGFSKNCNEIVTTDLVVESKGGAFADYDNDGDLDLYVSNFLGTPAPSNNFFYTNNGNTNHWINIKLIGAGASMSNVSAIGAKVSIRLGSSTEWQMREITANATGGVSSLRAHFGLGSVTSIELLRVEWPSGLDETFTNVTVDRNVEIVEGTSTISVATTCTPDVPVAFPTTITGDTKLDLGADCVPDFNLPNRLIQADDGIQKFFTYSNASGAYQFDVLGNPATAYAITPVITSNDLYNSENCGPGIAELIYNVVVNPASTGNNFFYTLNNPTNCDVAITLAGLYQSPLAAPCPSVGHKYCVNIKNNGLPLTGAVFTLDVAPEVLIDPSNPSDPSSCCTSPSFNNTTHQFTCNIGPLNPNEECQVCVNVEVLSSVPTQDPPIPLVTTATIDGTCNAAPVTFTKNLNEEVTCAFDPNDKLLVAPNGCGPENNIPIDEELVYQIRFQNLGNAPAFNVIVKDELDANLDISTFKVLGSSHAITNIQIIPDNKLILSFDNINLPPESTDPAGSIGFISFSIKPKSNLPDGTVIDNQAAIFFDLNEVIITNTVMNTLREHPFPLATFEVEHPCEVISNEFDFTYTGGTADGATFDWEFGSDASPTTSTEQDPIGILFSSSAERPITLTVERFGCFASVRATVNIVNPVACQGEDHKVLICHIPPGNPDNAHEICIDEHALKAHFKHGDCIGACGDPILSIDDYKEWDEVAFDVYNPNLNNASIQPEEVSGNELMAFPNPTSDNATVIYQLNELTNVTLSMYNIFGSEVLVFASNIVQDEGTYTLDVNTSSLANGVYFIVLKTDKHIVNYKLVIAK